MNKTETIEVLPITEIGRQLRACPATLRRRVAAAGLLPDVLILAGSKKSPTPAFIASRIPQIRKLLNASPETIV